MDDKNSNFDSVYFDHANIGCEWQLVINNLSFSQRQDIWPPIQCQAKFNVSVFNKMFGRQMLRILITATTFHLIETYFDRRIDTNFSRDSIFLYDSIYTRFLEKNVFFYKRKQQERRRKGKSTKTLRVRASLVLCFSLSFFFLAVSVIRNHFNNVKQTEFDR